MAGMGYFKQDAPRWKCLSKVVPHHGITNWSSPLDGSPRNCPNHCQREFGHSLWRLCTIPRAINLLIPHGGTTKYYTNHQIKKPQKILKRNLTDHVEKINSYILLLLGLIDSLEGANVKRVKALDEPKLAQLLLRLVPQTQQDQYSLIRGMILKNICSTLNTLKTIEKMDVHVPRKSKKSADKSRVKKQKGSSIIQTTILVIGRNPIKTVLSVLCEKHGGAKTTHNTGDCRKYEKKRNSKERFQENLH